MGNYSFTEENYVKAIYHLETKGDVANTNKLAEAMQTRAASATDMLKKLTRKKLVTYKPYYGCNLTPRGKSLALLIIRRHRLWEFFLSEKLGFNWQEVHDVAEELEHVGSEKLINKLDEFLGYPKVDPHGDPIPDFKGNMVEPEQFSLADYALNKSGIVVKIGEQSPALLEVLEQKKIGIGSRIKVLQKADFDQSMEIKINNKHTAHISKVLAENIFIKIV